MCGVCLSRQLQHLVTPIERPSIHQRTEHGRVPWSKGLGMEVGLKSGRATEQMETRINRILLEGAAEHKAVSHEKVGRPEQTHDRERDTRPRCEGLEVESL